MLTKSPVLVCFFAILVGCAGEPTDYEGDNAPIGPTVREQLEGRAEFAIAPMLPDGGGSFISADVSGDLAGEAQSVVLPVLGGHVTARSLADGNVLVEEVVVDFADVILDETAFPPRGLWLSGLQLRMAGPIMADTAWTADGEAAVVTARFDLLFDWGIVLSDGEVHPLATQRISGLEFQLDIERLGPGGLQMSLGAFAEGSVWRWASFVELSNLSIDLRGQGI